MGGFIAQLAKSVLAQPNSSLRFFKSDRLLGKWSRKINSSAIFKDNINNDADSNGGSKVAIFVSGLFAEGLLPAGLKDRSGSVSACRHWQLRKDCRRRIQAAELVIR
ncbi:MAG: hypothetical protein COW70_07850 [Hydrogenophilales bacterium CG18_big_fil_WC_8_21_14_2_50_58_12]|nr:MAG: hypothetical protein COW70_07850 [Hydrogenophilales bacterium CG18_big_fil_WC_8_21_14_2_50_58_12]